MQSPLVILGLVLLSVYSALPLQTVEAAVNAVPTTFTRQVASSRLGVRLPRQVALLAPVNRARVAPRQQRTDVRAYANSPSRMVRQFIRDRAQRDLEASMPLTQMPFRGSETQTTQTLTRDDEVLVHHIPEQDDDETYQQQRLLHAKHNKGRSVGGATTKTSHNHHVQSVQQNHIVNFDVAHHDKSKHGGGGATKSTPIAPGAAAAAQHHSKMSAKDMQKWLLQFARTAPVWPLLGHPGVELTPGQLQFWPSVDPSPESTQLPIVQQAHTTVWLRAMSAKPNDAVHLRFTDPDEESDPWSVAVSHLLTIGGVASHHKNNDVSIESHLAMEQVLQKMYNAFVPRFDHYAELMAQWSEEQRVQHANSKSAHPYSDKNGFRAEAQLAFQAMWYDWHGQSGLWHDVLAHLWPAVVAAMPRQHMKLSAGLRARLEKICGGSPVQFVVQQRLQQELLPRYAQLLAEGRTAEASRIRAFVFWSSVQQTLLWIGVAEFHAKDRLAQRTHKQPMALLPVPDHDLLKSF